MRRRCELACLLLAGCNAVFGIVPTELADAFDPDSTTEAADRDRDDIPDPLDPCIAGVSDIRTDVDGDGLENATDPCPLDTNDNLNGDTDTLADDCDPLPSVGGDRRRCFMAFLNPTINRELWTPRGDPMIWNMLDRIRATGTGTLIAGESLEGPATTSYDLVFGVMAGSVTLWLRTSEAGSPADIGCEIRDEAGSSVRMTIIGAQPPVTQSYQMSIVDVNRVQAIFVPTASPGTPNVRCALRTYYSAGYGYELNGVVTVPPGRFGFGVSNASVLFNGLLVLERDDQPTL